MDEIKITVLDDQVQAALERLREALGGSISVEVGSNVLYARVHQFGATIRAKSGEYLRFRIGDRWARKQQVTIQPRPFLGLSDDDSTELVKIEDDLLKRAWEGERFTGADAARAIGRHLKTSTQLRFRAQQSPDGAPWAPTLRGGQILRLTSRLRNSITYAVR